MSEPGKRAREGVNYALLFALLALVALVFAVTLVKLSQIGAPS